MYKYFTFFTYFLGSRLLPDQPAENPPYDIPPDDHDTTPDDYAAPIRVRATAHVRQVTIEQPMLTIGSDSIPLERFLELQTARY